MGEVLVDDEWYPASILSWSGTAGSLWANVRWWHAPGPGQLGTLPEADVRDRDNWAALTSPLRRPVACWGG